jgi:hypothetical protein
LFKIELFPSKLTGAGNTRLLGLETVILSFTLICDADAKLSPVSGVVLPTLELKVTNPDAPGLSVRLYPPFKFELKVMLFV